MQRLILILGIAILATTAYSQKNKRTITGYVTDAVTGEALIGATVLIAEQNKGTATDFDGSYTLKVRKKAKNLIVSYTGYISKTIKIGDATQLDILLQPGKLLDEVIVVGYGTIKKTDKTGAIESIKPKEEDVRQYDTFQDYLQGRATGVQVLSTGNELLSPSSIRIRGANSLRGDNEPLFVVDGIIINSSTEDVADPLSGGSSFLSAQNGLTGINPQDIESIEILKDASATAIYGSRGANGVVLITTKKGKIGAPKFGFKTSTRIGNATNLYNVLSSDDYVNYINEHREIQEFKPTFYTYSDGSIAPFLESEEFMEANKDSINRFDQANWSDEIYETSVSQSHRLTVSGGSDASTYYIGIGYGDAKGIVPGTRNRVGDILFKYTHKLSDRLTLSPRISTTYNVSNSSKGTENLGSSNASLPRQIVENAPLVGYVDEQVSLDLGQALEGPRVWINDYDDDATELRTLASMTADYKINDIFTYRLLGGIDFRNKERKLWFGKGTSRGRLSNGEAGIGELNRIRYNVDNTLMFKKKIGKKHSINGTLGVIFDATDIEQKGVSAKGFVNQSLRYNGISFGQVFLAPQFFESNENILSYLGRVNYTFNRKYLFTASFRRDGSSKFNEANRWSFFPSAAFAWKLTEEQFLANSKFWSQAKLRIGYGRTGSQAIKPYQTLTRYTPTTNLQSNGNGGGVVAIIPGNLANPDLRWETTDQLNIGFDFGFLNDRFSGNVDYYQKKTSDLLQVLSIGPSAGFKSIVTNKGVLQNTGVELGLSAHLLEGDLKWELFGNISFNKTKINDLGVPEAQFGTERRKAILGDRVSGGSVFKAPANIFIEGEAAGLFWGYQTSGIVNDENDLLVAPTVQGVATELGDIFYVDQDGDGNINEKDLTIIGDPNPDFTFGLGSNFSYKSVSLNFFFNGVQGNDIANGNKGRQDFATGLSNNIRSEAYTQAWRPGDTDATHSRIGYGIQGDFTDRMVEDGSFVRLTFVSLGYELPKGIIKGIDNINVFVSGHNLWLLTDYSGFDPEVNSFSNDPTRVGIDWNSFPNQKAFSFGLNVGF